VVVRAPVVGAVFPAGAEGRLPAGLDGQLIPQQFPDEPAGGPAGFDVALQAQAALEAGAPVERRKNDQVNRVSDDHVVEIDQEGQWTLGQRLEHRPAQRRRPDEVEVAGELDLIDAGLEIVLRGRRESRSRSPDPVEPLGVDAASWVRLEEHICLPVG
jgi:hypothetical protein